MPRFLGVALAISGALALGLLCLGLMGMFMDHEKIASFQIGDHRTLNVYAEGAFHYEPPGYIYFELKEWGQMLVPHRRFMGIGSERIPRDKFKLITAADDDIVALTLNNEIQMIHEFSSGFTWPGPYTNVSEPQWEMAEILLEKLRTAHPTVLWSRQDGYRKDLDRKSK